MGLLIKKEHLNILLSIFTSYCPNAEIWAYGSRLKGNAHEGSDLDLVVKSFGERNKSVYTLLDMINDSNIPFIVDIHEYNSLSESFQKEILKQYIVIFNKK